MFDDISHPVSSIGINKLVRVEDRAAELHQGFMTSLRRW